MDKITWHILNAMADDWESAETIQEDLQSANIDLATGDIVGRLEELLSEGLLELMPESKDKVKKWYGMTMNGRSIWEKNAILYGYEDR